MNNSNYIEAEKAKHLATTAIKLHSDADFAGMRKAGQLAASALDFISEHVDVGVTTKYLDQICFDFITKHGALPATVNYRGFRHSICTSINHVVCHGIPGEKKLKDGDILNIDVTIILDGWHGDTSRMFFAGKPSVKARRLSDITYECMMKGIEAIKPGATTGDLGHAMQQVAQENRCQVVSDFCGHGLGRVFHDSPNILNYGTPGEGVELRKGMFFTVEPMVNLGKGDTKVLDDGWTAVTRDRQLSAQFEHSVGVTDTGFEIFTLSPKGLDKPPYK